jgi:hypothetical protein
MRRLTIAAAAALLALSSRAHAQIGFDSLKTLWNNKQYAVVIRPLVQLRTSAKPEEQLTIDYMIATAHCRLPDANQRMQGRRAFDAMLLNQYRNLNAAQQKHLIDERVKCGGSQPANPVAPRFVVLSSRKGAPRATYNYAGGKQFYNVCAVPGKRGVISEGAVEGTRTQPVWARAQLEQARSAAQALLRDSLRSQGKVIARDGIVMATTGTQTSAQLDSILTAMLEYRDFYAREYGLSVPDTVLQVFLAPSADDLVRLANVLHGLPLDRRLIGYSALSDFTMVGIIPRTIYGTLMHELMHLLFRNHVAAAAPWLDEGLAALYEVSRLNGDRVVGLPNWRGQILHRLGGRYPPLRNLLESNWNDFEGYGDPDSQARNHALARYFVLYLQDKGKLPVVIRAINEQAVLSYQVSGDTVQVLTSDGRGTLDLIARTMGMGSSALESDFHRWLSTVISHGWSPC